MILVEDVKIREVPHDYCQVFHYDSPLDDMYRPGEGPKPCDPIGTVEMVRGQEFVDPRTKERMTVGFTQKTREQLRLPLGAFDGMSEHITKLHQENNQLSRENVRLERRTRGSYRELEAFINMGFWKRLRFLFTGRGMYGCPEAGDE